VQVRGQTRAGCALAALLSTTCTASLRGLGAEGCWLSRDAWRRRRPPAGAGAKAAAPAAESARATHTRRALRAMLPQRPVPPRPRGAAGGLQYFLASAPSKLLLCMVFPWCSDGAAAFTVVKSGSEHHETPYIILVRPLVNRQWQASWRRGRRLRLAGRQRRHSAATAPRVLSLGCPRRRRCGRLRSANRRRRPLARQAGAAAGMGTAGPGRALQCRQQPGEMLRRASAGDSGYDDRSSLNHEQNSAMHRPRMTVIRHHPPLPPLRSTERAPGPPFDFTFMLQRYRAQRGGFWILPAPAAAALDDLEQSAFGALPGRRSRR